MLGSWPSETFVHMKRMMQWSETSLCRPDFIVSVSVFYVNRILAISHMHNPAVEAHHILP